VSDTPRKSTFSIVAADLETGEVGCAVQSKYFSVGSVVPWAWAGVGAVATQAAGVAVYGRLALEDLQRGAAPRAALGAGAGAAGASAAATGALGVGAEAVAAGVSVTAGLAAADADASAATGVFCPHPAKAATIMSGKNLYVFMVSLPFWLKIFCNRWCRHHIIRR